MIVSGTGHRPKFLPCKYDNGHPYCEAIREVIKDWLTKNKPDILISGMALGFDTWIAEEALKLGTKVHAYIPFVGQGANWKKEAIAKYLEIACNPLTSIFLTQELYTTECFHKRDEAMVDDSDCVIALLNPKARQGGTFYTVKYAKSIEKEITNLWINTDVYSS